MPGIYQIDNARRLFEKLQRDWVAFYDNPSEDGLFDLLFPMYHLREWICPEGIASYRNKPDSVYSPEERLHCDLHSLPEYGVVRSLCNNAKHFSDRRDVPLRAAQYTGLRAGYGRCGDSLGITHYVVDGVEIRDIFMVVYRVYFQYFDTKPLTDGTT